MTLERKIRTWVGVGTIALTFGLGLGISCDSDYKRQIDKCVKRYEPVFGKNMSSKTRNQLREYCSLYQ